MATTRTAKKTAAKKTTAKKATASSTSGRTAAQDKERRESVATMTRDTDTQRDAHADTAVLAPDRSAKDIAAEAKAQVEGGTDLTGHESMVDDDHEYATKRPAAAKRG